MGEYYNIVPWYNNKEWNQLYSDIYSPHASITTKEEALKLLLIWKARCPSLPSGIESTLTLLEVYIQDAKLFNTNDDQIMRLAYSTAIMRFINHMLDSQTAKGSSLYKAAKNLSLPDWIVDLRHDTAHGSSLPSIELLREATYTSLDWLKINYWDKHKDFVNDYICGQINVDCGEENKISILMNFCISLSICAHTKLNIKNLAGIPDTNLRESILNDTHDLFHDGIDLSNLKKVSISSLINLMNLNSKRLLRSKNTSFHVNKALLGKDSLFLSMELLHFLSKGNFRNPTGLSKHYTHCFEALLTFLHTNNLLQEFVFELIKITQSTDENDRKRWLAAVWVSEILKALKKSSQFVQMMKKKKSTDITMKSKKELRSLFHHWFPSERGCGLLLDLFKSVPKELTDIILLRPIISSYNEYLSYYIKDILNIVEPQLPSEIRDKICKLAKLISSSSKSYKYKELKSAQTKVYTVEDVKAAADGVVIDVDQNVEMPEEIALDSESDINLSHKQGRSGIWQVVSKNYNWSACPIGKLPWDQDSTLKEAEINTTDTEHMDTEIILIN